MKNISETVMRTPKGNYKAFIEGQAQEDGQTNFRRWTIPGQPRRGFRTLPEAYDFLQSCKANTRKWQKIEALAKMASGVFHSDDSEYDNMGRPSQKPTLKMPELKLVTLESSLTDMIQAAKLLGLSLTVVIDGAQSETRYTYSKGEPLYTAKGKQEAIIWFSGFSTAAKN